MALYQLNKALIEKKGRSELPYVQHKIRGKLRQKMSEHLDKNNNDKSFPMKPQRVLADVKKVLGNDDIILSDVGAHKMWVAREYNCTIQIPVLSPMDFVQWVLLCQAQ